MTQAAGSFLRIPPFPGHRADSLGRPCRDDGEGGIDIAQLATALAEARVGAEFWGPEADLPPARNVLLCAPHEAGREAVIDAAKRSDVLDRAVLRAPGAAPRGLAMVAPGSDPWMLCATASAVIAHADDETALVAALSGRSLTVVGEGRFARLGETGGLKAVLMDELVRGCAWHDPFTGHRIDVLQIVALLSRWRKLIDANRSVVSVEGVARWKRVTADAMVWGGGPVVHEAPARSLAGGGYALAWLSRTRPVRLRALREAGCQIGEIEDGMIRSNGLGANCVPPLSIVVDSRGPHFDPAQASDLEMILQHAEIGPELRARGAALRARLVGEGISKYGRDASSSPPVRNGIDGDAGRLVLVTGQVEDDRSVICGAAGLDNLALLRRAREHEPDARIVFKPHPDVEAGHRKGAVPDSKALEFADEIDRTSSIAALLGRADAVHVLTSLAGFEALMRGLEVFTHGVPFYAGWGLTTDLGTVPARRTRQRTLDELVAATLILYPRYLDPVTRLPCEAEILIERMASGTADVRSLLIRLREMQGRLRVLFGKAG